MLVFGMERRADQLPAKGVLKFECLEKASSKHMP